MHPKLLQRLDRLWSLRRRVRRPAAERIGEDIKDLAAEVRHIDQACASVAASWAEWIPELFARVKSMRMGAGVMTVTVGDSGTQYLLACQLRSGLERRTLQASKQAIRRIRVISG